MSENELDRDYSYLEGKEIKVDISNIEAKKLFVKNIEYNMGISLVDEEQHPKICFVFNKDLPDHKYYDATFMTLVEIIEHGEMDDNLKNMLIGKNGGYAEEHAYMPASYCPFYGG